MRERGEQSEPAGATLFLVRHGKAAAGFDAHLDPGLDAEGRHQAEAAAQALAPRGPLPIYTSPLARARETAAPLETRWACTAVVESRVSELPSPTENLAERAQWIRGVLEMRWPDLDTGLQAWRRALIDCVGALDADSVIFSHYIAINAIVGAAMGDDRVVVFRPDHASITVVSVQRGRVELVERGHEAETQVR